MIIILESVGNYFKPEDYLFNTRNILHTYFGTLESYYYFYFIFTQESEFSQNNF